MTEKIKTALTIAMAGAVTLAILAGLSWLICWGFGRPWEPKMIIGILATCAFVRFAFPQRKSGGEK